MEHILVVVDMQNDFIDGALGTKEAREIVEAAAEKIREFKGSIYGTLDTHSKIISVHRKVKICLFPTVSWVKRDGHCILISWMPSLRQKRK